MRGFDDDRLRLGSTAWKVWRGFVLRSTALPLAELTEAIGGERPAEEPPGPETLGPALDLARADVFTQALLWQNPQALDEVVGSLLRHTKGESSTAGATGRTARRAERGRRFKTRMLGQYLQRYYTRNESVGFFGPVAWGTFRDGPPMTLKAGPGLTDQRHVMFEDWAVHELGLSLSRPMEIRRRLPPALVVGVARMGRTLLRGGERPRRLSQPEAALAKLVDGRRTAADIGTALGDEAAALDMLDVLEDEGYINWTFDIPLDLEPEKALLNQLAALEPTPAVDTALAGLGQLIAARDAVAGAATAETLSRTLEEAERLYSEMARRPAARSRRHNGKGFGLLVSAERRAVDLTVGTGLLDELAPPLGLLLDSARWFCRRIGEEATGWLTAGHRELAALYGKDDVPLDALIGRVDARLWDEASCAPVREELSSRWEEILAPDPAARRLAYSTAELAAAVAEKFAGPAPVWYGGRHHSPDVMIAAESVEAINRGEYQAVMGELHPGMTTFDCDSMTCCAADPREVVLRPAEAALADGPPRFVPLHHRAAGGATGFDHPPPDTYSSRYTYLSFGERAGARQVPSEPVEASSVTVAQRADGLVARFLDGTVLPLLTVLGEYLIYQTGTGFRVLPARPHTPRVTVDRLVIARECWRIPVEEFLPRPGMSPEQLYAQVQAVAAAHGLPRHCFWRTARAQKPLYLDLHSPLLTHVLVHTLAEGKPRQSLTFTEMLPTPDELWLPDGEDKRYTSELRITVSDG
ncbi:hypothetical protein JCM4814A_40930 [Streptomyces phaeofaciens JCM 4814]|uniref:Lantibiotic dehydratase n=1 Tax=Streptomyces phaeofaciens TaxID=68254 RepID=A0A918HNR1_9ACTN|nr:lantibiotic dehydratase [Streptomyces phaeofaciens]GGT80641.1 lantibiotic dehydratase [Streptomyces phaeofaciens]